MRLSKSAEMVLGLAISGGVAMVLSGGAFAADSGAGTTSQTVVSQPSTQPVAASPTPAVTPQATDAPASAVTVTKTSSTSGTATAATPTTTATPAAAVTAKTAPAATPTTVAAAAQLTVKEAAQPAPKPAASPEQPVAAASWPAAPVTAPAPAAPKAAKAVQPETITWSGVSLPIQPMIVAPVHAEAVIDLATFVPTAAKHSSDPAPQPASPSGALGRLTAELLATVVPPIFFTPLTYAALNAAFVLFLLIAAPVIKRFGTGFGALLRRGGFAHAARSDVAVSHNINIFATPSSLSFVTATCQDAAHF